MKQSGFTLLECLLYLAIFSVFMSGLIVILGNQKLRLAERERDFIQLGDEQFMFEKVEWLLNSSELVSVVDGQLQLERSSESLQLTLLNEQLFIQSTVRPPEAISPSYLRVENFSVEENTLSSDRHIRVTYTVDGIKTTHTLYVPL